jgi:hypothetical protein
LPWLSDNVRVCVMSFWWLWYWTPLSLEQLYVVNVQLIFLWTYRSLVRGLKRREYMKDFNLDGRIILKCVSNLDWINFSQNRDK